MLLNCNEEKILSNVNMVVRGQVIAHFRLTSASQKRACLTSLMTTPTAWRKIARSSV